MAGKEGDDNDRVTFDADQQKLVDKLVGEARTKARELAKAELEDSLDESQQALLKEAREEAREEAKAEFEADAAEAAAKALTDAETARLEAEREWQELADQRQARILELEPLELRIKEYEEFVSLRLETRLKDLGEAAETAIGALPEGLTNMQKLKWLNANEDLFGSSPIGTPKPKVPGEPDGQETKVRAGKYPKRL